MSINKRLLLTLVVFGLSLTRIATYLKPFVAVNYIYSPGTALYS